MKAKKSTTAAAAIVLAGGSLAVLAATRRWHQHWGATDEEIARPLPGDDLIADSKLDSTHAIAIHAPAEQIWPWLAQAGYGGRAGFYSYDALERRFGARDTDRLNPDLPALTSGDTVPFYPGMPMTVAVADPPHGLVLLAPEEVLVGVASAVLVGRSGARLAGHPATTVMRWRL
jgi:hypothetical protein